MIDLDKKSLDLVKNILKKRIPDHTVMAFGSRISGNAKSCSDLDLLIKGPEALSWQIIESIKDELSESNLKIRIDIIDWHAISDEFKKTVSEKNERIQ